MLSDERLRRLYKDRPSGATAPSDHLDEHAWEGLTTGEMPADKRRSAVDHVTRCSECAKIYRGLSLLEKEAQEFDTAVPAGALTPPAPIESRRPLRPLLWAGLAAAAALVLLVALPVDSPKRGSDEATPDTVTLRGAGGADRPRLEAPKGPVPAVPLTFSWHGTATNTHYQVQLLNADGELLWESDAIDGTSLALPPEIVISPGQYYWLVLGFDQADGQATASELESFRVEN